MNDIHDKIFGLGTRESRRMQSLGFINLKRCSRSGLFLLLLFAFTGCSDTPSLSDEVLAIVDGVPITKARVAYEIEEAGLPATEESYQQVLDMLIRRVALSQYAVEAGLEDDPLVRNTHEGILIARLKETVLFPKIDAVEISDDAVAAYYESNLDQFREPERVQVAVLWLNSRGQDALETQYSERLAKVREDFLAAPVPIEDGFGVFAITHSEHRSSRFNGGVMSPLEVTEHTDSFRNQVLEIAKTLESSGDVSHPTPSKEGIFLVRLLERQPEKRVPLAVVANRIRNDLRRSRIAKLEEEFDESIVELAEIVR